MSPTKARKPRPTRMLDGVPPDTRVVIADVTWEFYESFVDAVEFIVQLGEFGLLDSELFFGLDFSWLNLLLLVSELFESHFHLRQLLVRLFLFALGVALGISQILQMFDNGG